MKTFICVAEQIGEAVMEVDGDGASMIVNLRLKNEPGEPENKRQCVKFSCPTDTDLANDITDEVRHGNKLLHLVVKVDKKGIRLTHLITHRFKLKIEF